MKKFIYTFILLASLQFIYGQNTINLQQNDLDIAPKISEKTQKTSYSILAPYGIMMSSTTGCTGTTYYTAIDTITPNNDTIRVPISATYYFPTIGGDFNFLSINNISGTIDTVEALLVAEGSLTGSCSAMVFEYNPVDSIYDLLATSNSVSLSSMGTPGYISFVFPNEVAITNDVFVVFSVDSDDPEDAIILYTTVICNSNSLVTYIEGRDFPIPVSVFFSGFSTTPHVYLIGTFSDGEPPLSVNENTSIDQVNIYPNPVSDQLKINNLTESTDINIYNVTGQLIRTVSAATGSVDIDVNNLSSGIYIVKMQSGKNTRTEKIQVVR